MSWTQSFDHKNAFICQISAMTVVYIFKMSYLLKDLHNYSFNLKSKVALLIINGILKIVKESASGK